MNRPKATDAKYDLPYGFNDYLYQEDLNKYIDYILPVPSTPVQGDTVAEGVLREITSKSDVRHLFDYDPSSDQLHETTLQAMSEYAALKVAEAVRGKDAEIDRLKAACFACGSKAGALKSELTAAKERIKEMEKDRNGGRHFERI